MNTCIFRPPFDRALQMSERVIHQHAQDLYVFKLFWHEHKDENGEVYQLSPYIDAQFKGLAG